MTFPRTSSEPMWKPTKGTARAAALKRSAQRKAAEEKQKRIVRRRDPRCRRPHCPFCLNMPEGKPYRLHVAHLKAKGMGGDKSGRVSTAKKMIRLCAPSHAQQEAHLLVIEPLVAADGADWFCDFHRVKDGQRYYEGHG